MTDLIFHKMQALGNDFILIDCRDNDIGDIPFAELADRRLGIGCDQFLLLRPPPPGNTVDMACEFVNADGSLAGQCGNGLRGIALYLRDHGGLSDNGVQLLCADRTVTVFPAADDCFRVDMGKPGFFTVDVAEVGLRSFTPVSMGNPHAVLEVADVAAEPLDDIAGLGGWKDIFPEGVNIGIMQVEDEGNIRLRVHERGVGETPACGRRCLCRHGCREEQRFTKGLCTG